MKATFLHTADIHLNVKLVNKSFSLREREKRRIELWETFEKIINIAKNEHTKYLFIAGDLVNEKYSSFKDMKRLVALFDKIKETRVIITCGNHDPFTISSLYEFVEWPENVYIFKNTREVESIYFEDDNINIYSLSCGESDYNNSTEKIYNIKPDNTKINILLLHADVNQLSELELLPLDSNILKYKFNYCALGHVHDYMKIEENIIYPGTPEPYNFHNINYSHGIIKGEIALDSLHTEFVPVCSRKFVYKEIIIEKEYSFNQILDLIRAIDKEIDIMKDYVKIKLTGTVSNDISIDEIKNEAKQFFYYIEFEDNYTYEKNINEAVDNLRSNIIDYYIMQFENVDKTDNKNEKAFELGLQLLKSEGAGK